MTKLLGLGEAVSEIKDGSFITFSGMELNRAPMALVYGMVRQGRKGLRTVSIPNPFPTDVLIKHGCIKSAIFGFNGFSCEDGFIIPSNWRKAVEQGIIEWKETDMLEIIAALKAGASGEKFAEISGFAGTDYLKFNRYEKSGENIRVPALTPDFALIHAQYADSDGNVLIEDPLIDRLIASASKKVIVSAEKIVEKIKEPTLKKENVDFLVHCPNGASPTACFGFYDYGISGIRSHFGIKPKEHLEKSQDEKKSVDDMIVALAGLIGEGDSAATGVASPLPMIAAMFAKASKKRFDYFNCGSGAINPVLREPAYSSVTIKAIREKEKFMELPEVWDYAVKGKIDIMFFGAVQIAGNGDVNMTCIGGYKRPKVKLPGPAGAVTLRNMCKNAVIITARHTKQTFVEKVDFVTSSTEKDTIVVTNLGVLKLGKRPEILSVFSHSSVEEMIKNTGFLVKSSNAKRLPAISDYDASLLDAIDPNDMRYKLF